MSVFVQAHCSSILRLRTILKTYVYDLTSNGYILIKITYLLTVEWNVDELVANLLRARREHVSTRKFVRPSKTGTLSTRAPTVLSNSCSRQFASWNVVLNTPDCIYSNDCVNIYLLASFSRELQTILHLLTVCELRL